MPASDDDGGARRLDDVNASTTGWFERTVSKFVVWIGTGIESVLSEAGLSLSSIILGRVANAGAGVETYYQYYLADGNIYGSISAIGYSVLRSVVLGFLGVMLMWELAKNGLSLTGKARNELKEYIPTFILAFVFLAFMPNIVDLMIYVRDVALETALSSFSGGSLDLTGAFFDNWKLTASFFAAIMYIMAILITFYFAAIYIANALSLTVSFTFFPLIVILSLKNKSLLLEWVKTMIGTLMIPFIDGIILFVPLYLYNKAMAGTHTLMDLVAVLMSCFFIIPSRGIVRGLLGFGSDSAAERFGVGALKNLAGLAGMAGKAAKAGKEKIDEGREKLKDAREDERRAEEQEDLAKAEGGDTVKDTSNAQGRIEAQNNQLSKQFEGADDIPDSDSDAQRDPNEAANTGKVGSESDIPSDAGSSSSGSSDGSSIGYDGGIGHASGSGAVDHNVGEGEDTIHNPNGDIKTSSNTDSIGNAPQSSDTISRGSNEGQSDDHDDALGDKALQQPRAYNSDDARMQNLEAMEQAEGNIKDAEGEMSKLRNDNASLEKGNAEADVKAFNQIERLKARTGMTEQQLRKDGGDAGAKYQSIKTAQEGAKLKNNAQIKANNERLAELSGKVSANRNVADQARQNERNFANNDKIQGGSGASYSSAQQLQAAKEMNAVKARYANYKNFDTPEMAGVLSASDKAVFYRQRAAAKRREGVRDIAGGIGTAVGGTLAAGFVTGATAMYGPEMSGQAAQQAVSTVTEGSGVGGFAASTVGLVAESAGRGVDKYVVSYAQDHPDSRRAAMVSAVNQAASAVQQESSAKAQAAQQNVLNAQHAIKYGETADVDAADISAAVNTASNNYHSAVASVAGRVTNYTAPVTTPVIPSPVANPVQAVPVVSNGAAPHVSISPTTARNTGLTPASVSYNSNSGQSNISPGAKGADHYPMPDNVLPPEPAMPKFGNPSSPKKDKTPPRPEGGMDTGSVDFEGDLSEQKDASGTRKVILGSDTGARQEAKQLTDMDIISIVGEDKINKIAPEMREAALSRAKALRNNSGRVDAAAILNEWAKNGFLD